MCEIGCNMQIELSMTTMCFTSEMCALHFLKCLRSVKDFIKVITFWLLYTRVEVRFSRNMKSLVLVQQLCMPKEFQTRKKIYNNNFIQIEAVLQEEKNQGLFSLDHIGSWKPERPVPAGCVPHCHTGYTDYEISKQEKRVRKGKKWEMTERTVLAETDFPITKRHKHK